MCFLYKQKTAYEMRISDWSSDVCSSALAAFVAAERLLGLDAIWAALDTAAIDESIRRSLFNQAAAAMASQMADVLRVAPTGAQIGSASWRDSGCSDV